MVTGAFLRVKRGLTHKFLLLIMILLPVPCECVGGRGEYEATEVPHRMVSMNNSPMAGEKRVLVVDASFVKPLN